MTRKLKKQIGRVLAVALSVAMFVTGLPVEAMAKSASVDASAETAYFGTEAGADTVTYILGDETWKTKLAVEGGAVSDDGKLAIAGKYRQNDKQHGLELQDGGTITLSVDGPKDILIGGCRFGASLTINGKTLDLKAADCSNDGDPDDSHYVLYQYGGEAADLVFTANGKNYVPFIVVKEFTGTKDAVYDFGEEYWTVNTASEDGKVKFDGTFGYHEQGVHGMNLKKDATITVTVDGPKDIYLGTCEWGGQVSMNGGKAKSLRVAGGCRTAVGDTDDTKAVVFHYDGEAGDVVFTATTGDNYIPFLIVKDFTEAEVLKGDFSVSKGVTTYNFLDDAWNDAVTYRKKGAAVEAEDGSLKILDGASNTFKYNGTQHGIQLSDGCSIELKVNGPKDIYVGGCQFGASVKMNDGAAVSQKTVGCDDQAPFNTASSNVVKFSYTGEAGVVTLTAEGTCYIPFIIVDMPEEEELDAMVYTTYYNLCDGSVIPTTHAAAMPEDWYAPDGKAIFGKGYYFHDGKHGSCFQDTTIELIAKKGFVINTIKIGGCFYSDEEGQIILTDSQGTEIWSVASAKCPGPEETGAECGEFVVNYKGDDTTLYLTFKKGSREIYTPYIEVTGAKKVVDVEVDRTKIDAWDFAAEQFDAEKYNNKLTADVINGLYPGVEAGSTGKNIASFKVGDLSFNDGGYPATHRLRTTNTNITRYDAKSLKNIKGEAGVATYMGYVYSNKAASADVFLQLDNVQKGDIITVYGASNGTSSTVVFDCVTDTDVADQTYVYDGDGSFADEMVFYAPVTGSYKIYSSTEKLVVARIFREHPQIVTVSGSVDVASTLTGTTTLVFTNTTTKSTEEAEVVDGAYSVELLEQYDYEVTIKGVTDHVASEGGKISLAKGSEATLTNNIKLTKVPMSVMSGTLTGLDAETFAKAEILFVNDNIYKPVLKVDTSVTPYTYTIELENGATYDIVINNINDYQLKSTVTNPVTLTADAADVELAIEPKPVYAVTINPTGTIPTDLATATFTFTNLNEEGYVYTFTGTDDIKLRDGVYSVTVTGTAFVQKITSNVVVNGAAVTKDIPFAAGNEVTSWSFGEAAFKSITAKDTSYNGLILSNVTNNKTYALNTAVDGTSFIKVPVKAHSIVSVSYCYAAAGTIGVEGDTVEFGTVSGSTGTIESTSYEYNASEDGYVTIVYDKNAKGNSTYLCGIDVTPMVETKAVVTVGKTGCDYTTINDALKAIKGMKRAADEVTTISIQPGDYEEMLVLDIPNIKLVNASETPSIALKNGGVDIDDNAVRITSYYGHGYSYYSMDSNCKWNGELLAANKENGYESFKNPGSGTTSGSYWNATVSVTASNISAEGIIFENSFNQYVSKKAAEDVIVKQSSAKEGSVPRATMKAGDTTVQNKKYVERAAALAIYNNCSKIYFDNCKFIGRQDTLYGGSNSTVAFNKCSIYGGTDYIFGGMIAAFNQCDLVFNTYPSDKNDVGYITAAQQAGGRGYIFYECNVTSTTPGVDTISETVANPGTLGRPWQANTSEAIFVKTTVGVAADGASSLIQPVGWLATLGGQSPFCADYGTIELAGVDNSASRVEWAQGIVDGKLKDGSDISFASFLGDWKPFGEVEINLEVLPQAEAPVASVASGLYEAVQSVELTTTEANAKIYYTLDGTIPTVTNGTEYTGAVTVTGTPGEISEVVLKAIAVADGKRSSLVSTYLYSLNLPSAGPLVKVKGSIDLSEGLKAGTVYGKEGKIELTVLQDMPFKAGEAEVEGTTYAGFIQGSGNASPNKGAIPTTGAAFVINALADGSVSFVTKAASGKAYHIIDTLQGEILGDTTEGSIPLGEVKFDVEAGHVYYVYADGSKICAYAINYNYMAPSDYKFSSIGDMGADDITFKDAPAKGLLAGKIYGTDPTLATFTVKENMKWNNGTNNEVDIEGTHYLGYVQGNANAAPAKGAISETGAVFEIKANADGVLSIVTNAAKNSGKTYYFVEKDAAGTVTVITDAAAFTTGTLKYEIKKGNTYQFYAQGSKACVYAMYAECGTKARADWDSVAAPVVNAENATTVDGVLNVPFTMVIGDDGADSVTMEMYDADGVKVGEGITKVEGATGVVKFNPTASGKYTFKAIASREEEVDKVSEMSAAVDYVLPLATPIVKNYTNKGKGKVQIGWAATPEAESYLISYKEEVEGAVESEQIAVPSADDERAGSDWAKTLQLEVGKTYTVYVQAVRGEEKSKQKGSLSGVTVEDRNEITWTFASFGASTSLSNKTYKVFDENGKIVDKTGPANGFSGNANDGAVTVWSAGGAGKIVPLSTDGIAFYYTQVDPIKENFKLKAKMHVDAWTLSNGQDGFGLLATDRVGANGDITDPFWNNSYMAGVTKISYRWNKEAGELTTDSEIAANTDMKLGLGTIVRTGVPAGWTSPNLPANFISTSDTFETTCGQKYGSGTYNIIGNCTNADTLTGNQDDQQYVDIYYSIERNNTGYILTYYDATGEKVINSKTYYDEKYFDADGNYTGSFAYGNTESLMQMDKEAIYVGLFAARNATVTFSDIEFTTSDARTDAPAEERVRNLIDPSYSIASASNANSEDYDLQFFSNVPGYVTIQRADGSYVANNMRIAEENTKLHFAEKLAYGNNKYTWTMTPDKDYEIGGLGTNVFLKDYNVRSDVFTVTYGKFGNKYIYVSPDATAKGKGTAEDPVDIATAVKFVSAGQTILLAGGRYNLRSSLNISRGINGTADAPIRMIMDPSAKERPVIDFGKNYKTGMKLSGDYWIFQNFDVTNSGDGTDGLQVCGNHNIIDSVNTYRNGNTGIQLSRLSGSDVSQADWPSYNLVKNCTSYFNADAGYEDADGFAAKLTVGPGNVFDGCIAAYNADDGWDLFAKVETGPIGQVIIKNSIAYGNGWVFENGEKVNAGNGNGFKMGGSSITGYHTLINSIAFNNKAKGIDSNSCPDIQVENCITFNNGSYNIAMYTGNGVVDTDYSAKGLISYRTENLGQKEQLNGKGTQKDEKINNDTNYFWTPDEADATKSVSKNKSGATVSADWFASLEAPAEGVIVGRHADGTIDLGDFLKLTDKATAGVGAKDLDKNGEKSDYVTESELAKEKAELIAQGLTIEPISDQVYTGTMIKPVVTVTDGLSILTKKDYIATYQNALNVGTATVIIKGKGNYSNSVTTTFQIVAKDLEDEDVTFKNSVIALKATNKAQTPKPVVMWGKKKLALNRDYTLKYYSEEDPTTALAGITAPGRYTIEVTGKGNYTGTIEATAIIVSNANNMMSKAKVTAPKLVNATGQEIEFNEEIKVVLGGKTLVEGEDYEVEYFDNVKVGRAGYIVRGIGEYAGEKVGYFTIRAIAMNKARVDGIVTNLTYSGQPVVQEGLTLTMTNPDPATRKAKPTITLVNGTDYVVSYKNNNKAGAATISFTGIGMYTGKLTKSFKILPHSIADEYNEETKEGHIIVEGLETNYMKGNNKLENLVVKYYDNESKKTFYLTEKKDYTVTYRNFTAAGEGIVGNKRTPSIVIVGRGGYNGTLEKWVNIIPQDLDASVVIKGVEKSVTVTAKDMPFTGRAKSWKSNVVVTDINGKKLTGGIGRTADYVVNYYYAGTEDVIADSAILPVGTEIDVVVTPGPSGNYQGEATVTYKIIEKAKDISKAKVTVDKNLPIYYTGEAITLDDIYDANPERFPVSLTTKVNGANITLVYGEDYEVVPGTYVNNVKTGTAKVTVRGIGDRGFGGYKVISYKIQAKPLIQRLLEL